MTSDTTNILAWNKVKWCIYSLNWHFQVLFSSWSFLRSVFGSMQRICIMHNTRLCTKSNSAALQYCIRIINELIWIFLMLNTTWDFNKRFVFSTVFRVYCWMFHFFGLLLFHVPWMKQRSKCFDDVMSKWLQRLLLPLVIVVEGFPLFLRSATRFTPRAEAEVTIISYAHCLTSYDPDAESSDVSFIQLQIPFDSRKCKFANVILQNDWMKRVFLHLSSFWCYQDVWPVHYSISFRFSVDISKLAVATNNHHIKFMGSRIDVVGAGNRS